MNDGRLECRLSAGVATVVIHCNDSDAEWAGLGGNMKRQTTALEGIKVLDLSRVLAGPWCTQTLADLGADVWKVEQPGAGDETRSWKPPELNGESTYFMCANRSKRSIAVDIKHPRGQDVIRRLAFEADVLVENYRRGSLSSLGLGYEDLKAINPRLIYCSISGYGRTGSRADEAGYDFAIQAECGLMAITGEPDGTPMKVGVAIVDLATGMNAVQAILAAIIARYRTGSGQFIDLSLLDAGVSVLANVASGYLATDREPRRYGNAHAAIVPYEIFSGSDGIFALAVGNDLQFRALCEHVIGRPGFSDDPRFATNPARNVHRNDLRQILSAVFSEQSVAHWLSLLRRSRVPAAQVRSVPDVLNSSEIMERGLVTEVNDPVHGRLRLMRSPLHLRGTPPREPTPPPRIGEHTDAILAEVLGADEDEIASFRDIGAVE